MKFTIKCNVIFLVAIMLLVPLADMASCVECFSSEQENTTTCKETGSTVTIPAFIHSTQCSSHCGPGDIPLQSNSVHLCPICNNGTPLISSTIFSLNLSRSLFKSSDKAVLIPEVYFIPYIPPRSV